jgi:hypothetical protein
MRAYLAGSIEFSNDGGRGWRKEFGNFLEESLGDEVYDPAEDEKKNLTDEEVAQFRGWKTTQLDRFRQVVRKIIDFDLDLLERRIDYVVCYWDKNSTQGGGTPAELTFAYRRGIPVYLVTELPVEQVSGWVISCADRVFPDFGSLQLFLLSSRKQAATGHAI